VPDLALLDVMMPGMDGLATLVALRKIEGWEDVPVVFMTAKIQKSEVRQFIECGAIDVVFKPFDPMALAEQVQRVYDVR
jgi:CheY-like chemotaxis protein